jgi:hypothetical protein
MMSGIISQRRLESFITRLQVTCEGEKGFWRKEDVNLGWRRLPGWGPKQVEFVLC